ncbi:MAG: hypothetical protein AAF382_11540 [Pseudomonadota bacterium]
MRILFLFLALAMPLSAVAQSPTPTPTLEPVDEAESDASFVTYRDALIAAVVARDIDAILAMAAADIMLSFGGDAGHDALRAFLEVDPEQFSPDQKHEVPALRERNWAELETVLRLGGLFRDDGTFVAPYTFAAEQPADMDPFEVLFITGSGVALRDRPIRFGNVVTRLNYDVVTFRNWVTGTQFVELEMADGTKGFVHRDFARFLLDHRAIFAKVDGSWTMTHFIAGD